MTKAADLYTLQEIDLLIQTREATVADAETRLGETEELLEARETVTEARQHLQELQKRQRDAELEVDDVRRKIEPLEKKMYGGSVGSPKELMGYQQDVESIRSRQRALEDQVLEAMSAVEEAEKAKEAAQTTLGEVEAAWSAEQERLRRAKVSADDELTGLRQRRSRQSTLFDDATLRLYEAVRASHGGRAVAKVERGTCQGCRISLPMSLVQKARGGPTGASLVHCSSCERILYLT